MAKKNVLLVGESWATSATHSKGFDQFGSVTFHLGAEPLVAALQGSDFDLTYMPAHEAATGFPFDLDGLERFDAIILSDIGTNTFLLSPDVWLHGKPTPNRLKLIREWTRAGGGLVMIGGYYSFQGIDGKARWRATPVEEALPVSCLPYDDRLEIPEGFSAQIVGTADHPVLAGLEGPWPLLLGANEVRIKDQPGARFWRNCRRKRGPTRCSSLADLVRGARSRGRPTSDRTDCPRASWNGGAIGVSGSMFLAG
jgi:uncharacterized membrane protein